MMNFKLKTIEHKSVKHRKDFILDMIFINVGVAIMQIAINESFDDGVKEIHKNKHRKQVKKLKELHQVFLEKKDFIMSIMSKEDLNTLDFKMKKTSASFIYTMASVKEDVCLEFLAIAMFRAGLTRQNRKTPLNDLLKVFSNFMTHKKTIDLINQTTNYKYEIEPFMASKFANEVKY